MNTTPQNEMNTITANINSAAHDENQTMNHSLAKIFNGEFLTVEEAKNAMESILSGNVPEIKLSAFLAALKMRGEKEEELAGSALSLREECSKKLGIASPCTNCVKRNGYCLEFGCENYMIDTCGTGGDGLLTFNISTAAAIVAAAAGAKVAKHGNRKVSGSTGCADVLEELGITINKTPKETLETIRTKGFGFLFAPDYHSSVRHASKVRKELSTRTIFNLIGPLSNPFEAKSQIMGVYNQNMVEICAKVLGRLGVSRALVVHGHPGMDEISPFGKTFLTKLENGKVETNQVSPIQFGLEICHDFDEIKAYSPKESAAIITDIFEGRRTNGNAAYNAVVLNSGAAIYIAGLSDTIEEGVHISMKIIEDGRAKEKLKELTL